MMTRLVVALKGFGIFKALEFWVSGVLEGSWDLVTRVPQRVPLRDL